MDTDYTSAILSSDYETALKAFFFNYSDSFESTDNGDERCIKAAGIMIKHISDMCIEDIIDFIDDNDELIGTMDSKNIPQFSDINYVNTILSTVKTNPDGDYELFGYYYKKEAKEGAHRKYGENHYKTASIMGLVTRKAPFRVTYFGESYMKLSEKEKLLLRPKLYMKIPIIQKVMADSLYGSAYPTELMRTCLSESTVIRRRSNVKTMVKEICDLCNDSINLFDKFIWE
ncbi:MAG: hypothetical protein ACI4JM_06020 [Oscillospiraceae bacterium]